MESLLRSLQEMGKLYRFYVNNNQTAKYIIALIWVVGFICGIFIMSILIIISK